jgi:uncharacterized protein (DUF488 family)
MCYSNCTPPVNRRPTIFTIGHSTHPIETFLALLGTQQIALLVDVRSYPSSRRWPQFNQAQLQRALEESGIGYLWCRALGGRRHSKRIDSPHGAWEHPAFRAYADYTETPEFDAGMEELTRSSKEVRTAIMCSEGLWWRCHRRIISDHLKVRGWEVVHIMPDGKLAMHALPEFATVTDDRIVYDGGQQSLML